MRTGAEVDGGITCTACHRGADANSDTRGRLTILTREYKPGVRQMIRVMLEHPEAVRWGFQLTARLASNPARAAGTLRQTDLIRVRCGEGGPDGNCRGQTEFASHIQASTFVGTRNGVMWEIEWTPPAAGAGEVVFYAAGNAANNSGNTQGDNIYTTSARAAEESCNVTGTPRITSIRNGASFDDRVSVNSIITIGGSGFQAAGVNRTAGLQDIENNRFPSEMGCVAVDIGGSRAPLLFGNPTQINAQVPSISPGSVPVRVILNPGTPREIRSDAVNVTLGEYAPGFFRFLPTPCIAAVNADGTLSGDPSLLPFVRGSRIGEIVSLYATGLGALEPFYQSGEIVGQAVRVRDRVTIEWNGTPLAATDVLYVGSAGGAISGLYQINVRIPAGSRTGANHNQVRIIGADGSRSADNTTIYVQP
jgi:uncharacterized protein (TIGR03437 family)